MRRTICRKITVRGAVLVALYERERKRGLLHNANRSLMAWRYTDHGRQTTCVIGGAVRRCAKWELSALETFSFCVRSDLPHSTWQPISWVVAMTRQFHKQFEDNRSANKFRSKIAVSAVGLRKIRIKENLKPNKSWDSQSHWQLT